MLTSKIGSITAIRSKYIYKPCFRMCVTASSKKDFPKYDELQAASLTKPNDDIEIKALPVNRFTVLELAKDKLYVAQNFYDDFSGMTDVKQAQNKVIDIQNELQSVQERRRNLLLELSLIRTKLRVIHLETQKCMRGDLRYLELIKEEYDVLNLEKDKNNVFSIVDQQERDLFSHLTAAVKTSHEKERTQASNVKYWSIIGSCIGALLGIIATSINYYYRNTQYESIKLSTSQSVNQLELLNQNVSELQSEIRLFQSSLIPKEQESWGGYFKRHTLGVYRYFVPKK